MLEEIFTSKEIIGSIIGVNKYSSCCTCAKKVTIKGKIAFCDKCKMSQELTACNMQWSFKMLVQNQDDPKQKVKFNVYGHQIVQKLFTICHITETASEEEAIKAIFNTELLKLSFDTQSHTLIDIDAIDI